MVGGIDLNHTITKTKEWHLMTTNPGGIDEVQYDPTLVFFSVKPPIDIEIAE